MKKRAGNTFSLKWGVSAAVAFCWLVPVLAVVSLSVFLQNRNYDRHITRELESGTVHAMEQVEMRVESALESSKAASYEGIIPRAYRSFQENGSRVQLYGTVTSYLNRCYSRDSNVKAVFLTFREAPEDDYIFVSSGDLSAYGVYQEYEKNAEPQLMEEARAMDTGIIFREIDGELYMVRNMLDKNFDAYAVLVIQLNKDILFQSLYGNNAWTTARISIDDTEILLAQGDREDLRHFDKLLRNTYDSTVDGHQLHYEVQTVRQSLWGAMPGLRCAVLIVALLAVPMVLAAVLIFYRHVTYPVEILVDASNHVERGERGYQIQEEPRTEEFRKLTRHFNSMSTELKLQFEKIYLEQQALQEARIKALQSQINPHFLGNTLEIINWEARLAEDDKVSTMIEALSTMLDAAIGRDGRSLIPLEEELKYVDAYLYIIQQRMGDGLTICKQIDEEVIGDYVPRLLLQPLVENAVEHDISRRRESQLTIRCCRREENLCLEVEHDGTITPEDRVKIAELLKPAQTAAARGSSVGIRNLNQRIRLIYGEKASLTIEEVTPGRILASVCLPFLPQNGQ